MMRKILFATALAIAISMLSACGGGPAVIQAPPLPALPPAFIAATSGTPQNAAINTPFAAPLAATVTDLNYNPVAGVVVTFTAPPSGPSGTFAGGVHTAMTNANGVATSTSFTANGTIGPYFVTATVPALPPPANFILTNAVGPPAQVVPQSGSRQGAAINTPFIAPLVVQVVDSSGDPLSGVQVTFDAPSSGASVTFAGGVNDTATTDGNGVATSSTFTANGTAGGPYTVTATVAGLAAAANFSLTNAAPGPSSSYSFYVSGLESAKYGTNPYALAGSVTIDANGYVLAGEQDYKDDWKAASPQPSGDAISGGALSVNAATGRGHSR